MSAFIVFEGLNGAGKTTIAKALATHLCAFYIATPHNLLMKLRKVIDKQINIPTRFFFYMLGNLLVSDEIRVARKSQIVVCDRYVHSTIARHTLLGFNVDFNINSLKLEIPDISFFIFTSDEIERRKRIIGRGKKNRWDTLDENDELREKYIDYFRQRQEFIFIDTSHEKVEESLDKIKKILHNKGVI